MGLFIWWQGQKLDYTDCQHSSPCSKALSCLCKHFKKKKNQSKNPKKSKMSLYMIREDAALAACKAYQARVHPGTIKFEFLQICWGRAKWGQGEASSRRLRRLASSQARTLTQIRETVCHDAYTKDLLICFSLTRNECRRRGPTTSNQTAERHRNRVFLYFSRRWTKMLFVWICSNRGRTHLSIWPNTKTTIKRNNVGTREHEKQIKREIRWHDLKFCSSMGLFFFFLATEPNKKKEKRNHTTVVVLMVLREFSSNYFF